MSDTRYDMPMEFELKQDHITLLGNFYIGWQDCETGAPEIDPKRPYGNSYVLGDIVEILGEETPDENDEEAYEEWERTRGEELMQLHYETATALQIILAEKSFEPGRFKRQEWWDTASWKRIE